MGNLKNGKTKSKNEVNEDIIKGGDNNLENWI